MQNLYSHRTVIKACIAVLIVCSLGMIAKCAQSVKWVGRTDLQVHFVVMDTATDQPIPNATVQIRAEGGGFCSDREPREFAIATDSNGHAQHDCEQCRCCGSRGCFEDTFTVYLPWWRFNAQAKGYHESELESLDVPKHSMQVQRGKEFPTITIPIRLRKSVTE